MCLRGGTAGVDGGEWAGRAGDQVPLQPRPPDRSRTTQAAAMVLHATGLLLFSLTFAMTSCRRMVQI